jgi:hypothetical protein
MGEVMGKTTFTRVWLRATLSHSMTRALRAVCILMAVVVFAGCATMSVNTITNLTPSRLPRRDNGQYLMSVAFDSKQRTILKETIRVEVLVGEKVYPMVRTPLVESRWETYVPVSGDQDVVNYRYRISYDYKAIPEVDSMVTESRDYQLQFDAPW